MSLPPYVVVNDPTCVHREVLTEPSEEITFPLSPENLKVIQDLEAKYDAEENCAGLAAPQIGYHKRIIIFGVFDDPLLKKWRSDLTDTMPKTIWINPSYRPLHPVTETVTDWEACFSVKDLAGPVPRYTEIAYEAYTPDGKKVTGIARGFLARVLQHEIDHVNGLLFLDRALKGQVITIDEYRARRRKEAENKI